MLHPPNLIHASLARVMELTKNGRAKSNEFIGSLTTLDRDTWANVREELVASGNSQTLRQVDDALFLLCLDDTKSTDPLRLSQSLLCGDDGKNRWFDKCFQLIIDGNGQVNFIPALYQLLIKAAK